MCSVLYFLFFWRMNRFVPPLVVLRGYFYLSYQIEAVSDIKLGLARKGLMQGKNFASCNIYLAPTFYCKEKCSGIRTHTLFTQ